MGELVIKDGQKFVLIGDSITDCGRRDSMAPFGGGYVALLRDMVLAGWPERKIAWVNKGIGGETVVDLQNRWEDDVIREAPDWLSIKIGINDLHRLSGRHSSRRVPPAQFRTVYHEILSRTKAKLPKTQIVLIGPFYVSTDRSGQSFRSKVLDLLPEYLAVVDDMAKEFGTRLVRLQPMFERQMEFRSPEEFSPEAVHPNRTGHVLIAKAVLKGLME